MAKKWIKVENPKVGMVVKLASYAGIDAVCRCKVNKMATITHVYEDRVGIRCEGASMNWPIGSLLIEENKNGA